MTNNDIVPGFDEETNENLKITLEAAEGVEGGLILRLSGILDTYNSNAFQKRVLKAIGAGFIRLIFDCGELTYVSSTGMGSFSLILKSVKPKGGNVALVDVQPKVGDVFRLLGFSQFFSIHKTTEEALNCFLSHTKAAGDLFPKIVTCLVCYKKLKAVKAGRFRCPECKTILAIDNGGQVSIG